MSNLKIRTTESGNRYIDCGELGVQWICRCGNDAFDAHSEWRGEGYVTVRTCDACTQRMFGND